MLDPAPLPAKELGTLFGGEGRATRDHRKGQVKERVPKTDSHPWRGVVNAVISNTGEHTEK